MSLPIPLVVRLITAATDRNVERECRRLWFRKVVPGGNAAARLVLDRPLTRTPAEIAYYGTARIGDARNALPIWDGRLEDPGKSAGSDGEVWELAAVGPAAAARDRARPRIWVDTSVEYWLRSGYTTNRSGRADRVDLDSDPEVPAIDLTFAEGSSLTAATTVDVMYRTIYDCGQKLGRVRAQVKDGQIDATRENRLVTRNTPTGSSHVPDSTTWSTGTVTLDAAIGGSNAITAGDDVANLRITQVSGSVTAGVNAWAELFGFVVRSQLKDINGNDITAGGSHDSNFVLAHEVIRDMFGRGDLASFDPAAAVIATNSYQIEQLAFPSGVYPVDVFDRLMELEPAFYWAAWELLPSGKYRFEWRTWPTTIRYEADVLDGFDAPGSAEGLYNEALIASDDPRGRPRTKLSTGSVPELTAAGLTRTYVGDLSTETGSTLNAAQAGAQALLEHATPPNAGTLTISRPIVDFQRGRMVDPWEILPGELIRVRGVRAHPDSLNATSRDGVTVFKIAAMEYDTDTAAARLELDSYPRNVAQALAALAKRSPTRRRRR